MRDSSKFDEKLDPHFAELLESQQPSIPQSPLSFFSEEQTPRDKDDTEYDCDVWVKMFISMLPRPNQALSHNVETFRTLLEINSNLTRTEVAVIRLKILKDSKGPKGKELDRLYDRAEDERWSQEKLDFEITKVEKKWGAHEWELRHERLDEIHKLYDGLKAEFTEDKVADFSNPHVLATWRFLTRNPCFPFDSYTMPNGVTIPASHLSLVEAFEQPQMAFSDTFGVLRKWFYSAHPNIDAKSPSEQEFNDWKSISVFYNTSEQLSKLTFEKPTIESIATFDNDIFKFYEAWVETKYNKSFQQVETKYDKLLKDGEVASFASQMKCKIYPYASLRLYNEDDDGDINIMMNRLTRFTFNQVVSILKHYNHNVISDGIKARVARGDLQNADAMIKLATSMKMDMKKLEEPYLAKLRETPNPFPEVLKSISFMVLSRVFSNGLIPSFKMFIDMYPRFDQRCDYLTGFADKKALYPAEFKELSPILMDEAIKLRDSQGQSGRSYYLALDVIEALEQN